MFGCNDGLNWVQLFLGFTTNGVYLSTAYSGLVSLNISASYRYFRAQLYSSNSTANISQLNYHIVTNGSGYQPLLNNTNYTIATDSTAGLPKMTYTDSTTNSLVVNEGQLLIYEAYRRFYPVIRDKNQLILTDGTNPMTITNTTIGGKYISDIKTNNNLSIDYITYVALSDYSSGTNSMSNLFSSFIIDISVTSGDSGTGQNICYLPNLTNGQYIYSSFKIMYTELNNGSIYLPVFSGSN